MTIFIIRRDRGILAQAEHLSLFLFPTVGSSVSGAPPPFYREQWQAAATPEVVQEVRPARRVVTPLGAGTTIVAAPGGATAARSTTTGGAARVQPEGRAVTPSLGGGTTGGNPAAPTFAAVR